MKKFTVSIPKPCHEDWNKMSPEEKGRFCDKCSKCVLDFTTSTTDQINEFIENHEGEKLCGRFRNDQIISPVILNISKQYYRDRLSFFQAFVVSLLIAFGTTLFSCTTHSNEKVEEIKLDKIIKTDSVIPDTNLYSTVGFFLTKPMNPDNGPVKKPTLVTDDIVDTIQLPDVIINSSAFSFRDISINSVGIMIINTIPGEETDTTSIGTDSMKTELNDNTEVISEHLKTFPNPSAGIINIKINCSQTEKLKSELYDLNGRLIRILSEQEFPAGENKSEFDLSDIENGNYIIVVSGNNFYKTSEIVITK